VHVIFINLLFTDQSRTATSSKRKLRENTEIAGRVVGRYVGRVVKS